MSMVEVWFFIFWVFYEKDIDIELDRKFDDGKIYESKGRYRIESVIFYFIV